MLSLIIAVVGAIVSGFLFRVPCGMGWGGSISLAILVFLIINMLINLLMKKKITAAFGVVQAHLGAGQAALQHKANMLAQSGRATQRTQDELMAEQKKLIHEGLALLDQQMTPFEKWNVMIRKQVNTIRAQFYFQLQDFDNADKYFKDALLYEPTTYAMYMVRLYKRDEKDQLKKAFEKAVRRFKDAKGVLIYALYSWILVKENKIEDALAVLSQAKTKAESPVLQQNLDNLKNNHPDRFSNAALPEWYSLGLETPRVQRVRQQPGPGFRR